MTDFSKVLGVIASTLQLDATELADALKDGETWLPDEEITKKLGETISGRVKAAKEEQRKRALRESSESLLKWAKAQGFTPDDAELKGTALLDAFAEHLKSSKSEPTSIDPATAGKLTRDDLAKLPEVQKLITEANAQVMEKYKGEVGKELDRIKSEYTTYKEMTERERVEAATLKHTELALEQGNIMLEPTGAKVSKAARIRSVFRELDLRRIRLNDKQEPYFINEHGEPLVDADFGAPVDFYKRVIAIGKELYDERGPDSTKSGANPSGQSGQGANGKFRQEYFFKSDKELSSAMFAESDPAKRAKMSEDFAFQQQQQKAAGN